MPVYPLIEFDLVLNGGAGERRSIVPMRGQERKTPAEVAVLLKVHKADLGAPEEVVQNAVWTGDVEMNENDLRQELRSRYGVDANTGMLIADMLFPGPLPTVCEYPDKRAEWAAEQREKMMHAIGGPPAWLDVEEEVPAPEASKKPLAVLREEYKATTGKNWSPAWSEDQLRERLEAALKADAA